MSSLISDRQAEPGSPAASSTTSSIFTNEKLDIALERDGFLFAPAHTNNGAGGNHLHHPLSICYDYVPINALQLPFLLPQ
jgi:hypothetical protein